MVNVIESKDVPADAPHIEFNVYRSPNDRKIVMGYVSGGGFIHGTQATWITTPFGVPVSQAYATALGVAEHYGLAVWVRDKEGLFPPDARPS